MISVSLVAIGADTEAQTDETSFAPDAQHPFGRMNPAAPPETAQFAFMIGNNDCTEERRNSSGEWTKGTRSWDAYYDMNGFAIRDGGSSGKASNANIRAYDVKEKQWHVTFFSMPTYSSGLWKGGKKGDKIVLKQPQKAPNGMDGSSRLTFFNMTDEGFDWIGEWVSENGSIVYPFWKISCQKSGRK
ncbi:MAG: hypothetical protein AAF512_04730 [Pseudomonadota bacterium]